MISPPRSSYPGDDALYRELFMAEDRHCWFASRNKVIAAVLGRITPSLGSRYRVLEIGCGTGNVLRVLEEACGADRVVATDLHATGLAYARQRVTCALVQADMHHLPFKTYFDLIAMFDVMEHLADDAAALRRVSDLLRAGGSLLVTVPASMRLWSYADEFAGHYRRYSRRGLMETLRDAGFTVEYLTPYMAALFPVMWLRRRVLTRIRERDGAAREKFREELRLAPLANAILRWILDRDVLAIRSGRILPFGTSLIAVATKNASP